MSGDEDEEVGGTVSLEVPTPSRSGLPLLPNSSSAMPQVWRLTIFLNAYHFSEMSHRFVSREDRLPLVGNSLGTSKQSIVKS